jgi:hypothetical protein
VHTYPLPMTLEQQHILIVISDQFGVADAELLYIGAMTAIDLVVAIALYRLAMKLWRACRNRAADSAKPHLNGD